VKPVISVEGLVKRYGDVRAVDGISFEAERGEVFALLGPNGAGKTTTVEILEGLRAPDEGKAEVLGLDPRSELRRLAPRIGVMPQTGDLYAGIRTAEALRLFASFYEDARDTAELAHRLGLDRVARTPYRRLSGGERKRLSLALALVGRPQVAFLDEPTAGMDIEAREATWALVGELREREATVVLTTHQLDEAERVADRVAIVREGRIVALGAPSDLVRGVHNIRFSVDRDIAIEDLSAHLGVAVSVAGPHTYVVAATDPEPALVARLTAWLATYDTRLRHLDVGARSLEDTYRELTR
jgi:ABC-2 type transport system ATP-binding protein